MATIAAITSIATRIRRWSFMTYLLARLGEYGLSDVGRRKRTEHAPFADKEADEELE